MPLNSQKLDELVERIHVRAQGSIIGMDAEWQPEFVRYEHNKVALLQLNLNNDCFLIRLKHIEGPMPSSLQRLLADASIPKVGLNIMNDVQVSTTYHLLMRWMSLGACPADIFGVGGEEEGK